MMGSPMSSPMGHMGQQSHLQNQNSGYMQQVRYGFNWGDSGVTSIQFFSTNCFLYEYYIKELYIFR